MYLVIANCGDYYCGCGGDGHICSLWRFESDAKDAADRERNRMSSGGTPNTKHWRTWKTWAEVHVSHYPEGEDLQDRWDD